MRHVIFVVLAAHMSILTGWLLAGDQSGTGDELTTLKREYADVLALQGTSKGEILAIAELDASGLIAAGLDPARMKQLPELGRMTPGVWYFLPKGQLDPHHAHAMPAPTIAIAVNVK
jgi:hypothetical protein